MDSIGLFLHIIATQVVFGVWWQFAFTGKRRVIDPPFSGLVTGLPKAPPEIARNDVCQPAMSCRGRHTQHTRSSMNRPYRSPHPDSEVNSLWSMEQWDQGKSAKWMRNFGRSIGSKG